jgi:hypothetical protein
LTIFLAIIVCPTLVISYYGLSERRENLRKKIFCRSGRSRFRGPSRGFAPSMFRVPRWGTIRWIIAWMRDFCQEAGFWGRRRCGVHWSDMYRMYVLYISSESGCAEPLRIQLSHLQLRQLFFQSLDGILGFRSK